MRQELWCECVLFAVVALCATLLGGCVQTRLTEPKRSAVEQLLLSTAADRALEFADVSSLKGKKTYVDPTYFESEDKQYVIGSIRDLLSRNGALLVSKAEDAAVIVEARSGALSIDSSQSILGIPKIPVPIPFTGTVETPELYLVKSEKQFSTAKIALLAYEQQSRTNVVSSGPLVGRANIKYFKILGLLNLTKTTIPEKQKHQSSTTR